MTYAKLKISAQMVLLSGLHIGTSNAFSAIGATDSPIIKDPVTNFPIVPGSSLKGKMRSLLARATSANPVKVPSADNSVIRRLFGDSKSDTFKLGRVIFRDAILVNKEELEGRGVRSLTEVKFENTIDRITAKATPRQIERAIRESCFAVELIYEVKTDSLEEVREDLGLLRSGFELLELDYLGGSGSRGYGKVAFKELSLATVFGDYELKGFEELFHLEG